MTLVQTLDVITEKPKLKKPVEKNTNNSFLKPSGSNITFQCIVQAGIPKPQALEWKFESKILNSKNDSMLTISNLSSENEGSYQCMAVNEYGSDAIEYELEVVSTTHSSEIRGLRSTKCSSETLQNLLYFMDKKTHVVFFVFHFVQLYIFTL